CQHYNDLVPTF
nr:immunoglobulin light chain junction region [Macaca mulatta]MOX48015.1 immunoglobulin light chain junction region [Macaca mulatta]MOX48273.1 immunoglobulin light chain junction region [Macaca mulatta]MOX48278.1 immunoglobulin light chain junction region [Macaca mulatta]MOX48527.1 immunoglobulin light chain junction region [Macaca mulatta]